MYVMFRVFWINNAQLFKLKTNGCCTNRVAVNQSRNVLLFCFCCCLLIRFLMTRIVGSSTRNHSQQEFTNIRKRMKLLQWISKRNVVCTEIHMFSTCIILFSIQNNSKPLRTYCFICLLTNKAIYLQWEYMSVKKNIIYAIHSTFNKSQMEIVCVWLLVARS